MDWIWSDVKTCFESDDGSLPEIEVANLSSDDVIAIYSLLRLRTQLIGGPPEFWSEIKQASMLVDSVPNAAALVATDQAEPFHLLLSGLKAGGTELPELGMFVFQDMIAIDYRMGRAWGPSEVTGLFLLLQEICLLAPSAVVRPAERCGPPDPILFIQVWSAFMSNSASKIS